ncbi:MAG: D-glycero-beta-D-manno-heptose 1-phosphate adenylyltransferase [Bdellovibrionaceae bacterium]|nr:D-glycero-beta-D-manno-heptose 1-phosphate adenylyltransferase [Pseudobdellovibrionaceae bacterium]MBC7457009.1 D-glycero-beta-D-manno-heptose 1-phosphate adenylyltransferase [Pseudobdellovibrionaceae bacterium]
MKPAVKVLTLSNLDQVLSEYRKKNKKIVFTNGCFDLIHIGHVRYLEQAKSLGDILIVGINTDASVQVLKGPTRPIQNENDRAEILASLKAVDHTVLFGEQTPLNLIKEVKPDLLVKGGDWKPEQIVGSDFVLANGGQVKSLQFVNGKSTTSIIEKSKT